MTWADIDARLEAAAQQARDLEAERDWLKHKLDLACKERDALMPAGKLLAERDRLREVLSELYAAFEEQKPRTQHRREGAMAKARAALGGEGG